MVSATILTAAGPLAKGLFGLFDDLFTSEEERLAAKLKLMELEQSGALAQIGVNKQEAQHDSMFVAGWRPFIGWVCGTAFAWHFVLLPITAAILAASGVDFTPPQFEMSALMTVLGGMLGLGGLRTYEKLQGVSSGLKPSSDGIDRRAK